MSLLLFTLLWIEPFATAIPVAAFVQEKNIFEALANVAAEALKAFKGKQAGPALPILVQPDLATPDRDKQEFKSRLQAHGNAMRQWLEHTCELTDEQRAKLTDVLEKDSDFESWQRERPANANNQQRMLGDCFPILFTKKHFGFATRLQYDLLKTIQTDLLTADQKQRLAAASDERTQFRNAAFRDYIISIVDNELYLTNDQRVKLSAKLNDRTFDDCLFSFQPQSYYLPYESINNVMQWGDAILNEKQQRLYSLTSNTANRSRNDYILFSSDSGISGWYKQIEEASIEQRDIFLRGVAVRIAYYESEMHISPEQSAHLTVAGKGAAVAAVADWKDSTHQTVEQMEQQVAQVRGNFSFAANKITIASLDRNAIWLQALKTDLPNDKEKIINARYKANRLARANAVLAMLDQELWLLRADQRQPLLDLIETSLPRRDDIVRNQEYLREITLLAHPLFKIPDAKIDTVLNEHQRAAWKQMKTHFHPQNGNNYLMIPLKMNRGELGIQLD